MRITILHGCTSALVEQSFSTGAFVPFFLTRQARRSPKIEWLRRSASVLHTCSGSMVRIRRRTPMGPTLNKTAKRCCNTFFALPPFNKLPVTFLVQKDFRDRVVANPTRSNRREWMHPRFFYGLGFFVWWSWFRNSGLDSRSLSSTLPRPPRGCPRPSVLIPQLWLSQ